MKNYLALGWIFKSGTLCRVESINKIYVNLRCEPTSLFRERVLFKCAYYSKYEYAIYWYLYTESLDLLQFLLFTLFYEEFEWSLNIIILLDYSLLLLMMQWWMVVIEIIFYYTLFYKWTLLYNISSILSC